MASAVAKLYPGASFGFGPSIEHGFYYDFDLPVKLEDRDLERIEQEMRAIAKRSSSLACEVVTRDEARRRLAQQGQSYKVEALDLIPEGEKITFYRHGDWEDLCEGPHVDRLDRPFFFKLLSVAGAYWRGDEHRPMLQRIYGTAFWTKEELEQHLAWLEEVRRATTGARRRTRPIQHPRRGRGRPIFWHRTAGGCGPARDSGGRSTSAAATDPCTRRTFRARRCSPSRVTSRSTRT
jgi:threonyl-tRNA synthetase